MEAGGEGPKGTPGLGSHEDEDENMEEDEDHGADLRKRSGPSGSTLPRTPAATPLREFAAGADGLQASTTNTSL